MKLSTSFLLLATALIASALPTPPRTVLNGREENGDTTQDASKNPVQSAIDAGKTAVGAVSDAAKAVKEYTNNHHEVVAGTLGVGAALMGAGAVSSIIGDVSEGAGMVEGLNEAEVVNAATNDAANIATKDAPNIVTNDAADSVTKGATDVTTKDTANAANNDAANVATDDAPNIAPQQAAKVEGVISSENVGGSGAIDAESERAIKDYLSYPLMLDYDGVAVELPAEKINVPLEIRYSHLEDRYRPLVDHAPSLKVPPGKIYPIGLPLVEIGENGKPIWSEAEMNPPYDREYRIFRLADTFRRSEDAWFKFTNYLRDFSKPRPPYNF